MIKLEHVVLASPEQMEFIIEGMRNPMNSWEKSDTCVRVCRTGFHEDRPCDPGCCNPNCSGPYINKEIGPNDLNLMQRLSNAGTEHRKYMRMMPVYVRITAPLYWWKEMETYKIGTVANSCSTMHKIHAKEFTLDDFSTEHLISGWVSRDFNGTVISIPGPLENLVSTIELLNNIRETYLYVSNTPKEKIDWSCTPSLSSKDIWYQLIQLLPSSYNQARNVMMNYEVLANIYRQRKNHKLAEWHTFIEWIETLPYSELITGKDEELMTPDEMRKALKLEPVIGVDLSHGEDFTSSGRGTGLWQPGDDD